MKSLVLAAAVTTFFSQQSPDYNRGYCDAAKSVWQNRNNLRAMNGYAPETQDEAMKRIYKRWPADPPPTLKGHGAPITDQFMAPTIQLMLDSVDLYVVLPQCDWKP